MSASQRSADLAHIAETFHAAAGILRPPPMRTAAEWADENRVLPIGSPEPGPWRSARVPFWYAIYAAFCDRRYDTIVAVMASQMAKTEAMLNILGHRFCDGPYVPALYIGPTEKQVRSMSNDRFTKMIQSTPMLRDRLAPGHANKVTEKFIAGVRLGFAWAGSATELASHPAGIAMVDERDRMMNNVGDEGDPVELARARLSNYYGAKLGVFSTPTIEGASPIWALYEEGTMMKWAWPCWHCNALFVPTLALLVFEKSDDPKAVRESARVACPHCGGLNEDKHKTQMNAAGRYLPHALAVNGEHLLVDKPRETTTASFWASGLCSPWRTYGQRALRLMAAFNSRDPDRIQTVINTGFGELFKQRGTAPEWQKVDACRVMTLGRNVVPSWSRLVTMGVDVQKNGLYFAVRAWGFNSRSHLLNHGFIHGETESDAPWQLLEQVLNAKVAGRMLIDFALIDSGYKPGHDSFRRPEHKVYEVCRRLAGRALPSKGHDKRDRPVSAAKIDVSLGGRTIKGGMTLWHIDTDHVKTWIHAQVEPPEGAERLWTLHSETDEDYCKQLVSESLVVKPTGRRVWIPTSKANHYLDCFDKETQLLTERGWVGHDEHETGGLRYATVNLESDRIEYQPASHVTVRYHDGDMVQIKGRRIDVLVTPNHRMVTTKKVWRDGKWVFSPGDVITLADDLSIWDRIKLCSGWDGEVPEIPLGHNPGDWMEFLGWYVAEGHRAERSPRNKTVTITQNPGAKLDRIMSLLERMSIRWRIDAGRQIRITSVALHDALDDCYEPGEGRGCYRKRVPAVVRAAKPDLIERFLDAAILGDGWTQGSFRTYATTSPRLADDIQELFLKIGAGANIRVRTGVKCNLHGSDSICAPQYHVSETKTKHASLRRSNNESLKTTVPYQGIVHCVTVPNGTLVARRNGRMFIAGNCEVLARAAALIRQVHAIPAEKDTPEAAETPAPPQTSFIRHGPVPTPTRDAPQPPQGAGSSWFSRYRR